MNTSILLCCHCHSTEIPPVLNYCSEIIIGLITSALAAILAFIINRIYLRINTDIMFNKLTGNWLSYAFINDYNFDKSKLIGEIDIKKTGDYKLYLKYTEKTASHVWEGDIYMNKETPNIGKVCWRHIISHGEATNTTSISGFKDIVIEKNYKYGVVIRLIGEREKGYGDELLIRKYLD